ncbi:MAG: tRNA-dihydrouridine synthase family protein [Candidatus Colwellbacteria bacterium]|nr:tRNA-dihydrouridine synthase family protein [Candidatus Colwellbacteria bacterium]MDD3752385.1 tRNA-dihydrouridine synthase family protein [Candidatus Colwellbacteria bacterium]MDD4818650.1 tRNA-dihydrouridine synthase family protein [Candidatus Colwellbacteria bacterium]
MESLNFWKKLRKPVSASAPMAGVSDAAFRKILSLYGKPDIIWTEMVSLAGIKAKGEDFFNNEMMFSEEERPIVLQFFGSKPEEFELCGRLAKERGFNGVDINMGCPDKGVEKQGAGACLMNNLSLAREIICSAKEKSLGLPISIKTRLAYINKRDMEKWILAISAEKPTAITIHGRTRSQRRRGNADWEFIKEACKIIKSESPDTIVIGNGDILSKKQGEELARKTGVDGYMVGRALVGNPWFFTAKEASKKERLTIAEKHLDIFKELFGENEPFDLLKKHFAGYASNFEGAKEIRTELMEAKTAEEAKFILKNFNAGLNEA